MEAMERREQILEILRSKHKPLSGGNLAEELGVSRQVIVQDIALLRAGGEEIFATPQGYVLSRTIKRRHRQVLAAQHDVEGMAEELAIIVSLGGKIIDVVVEHPLYGEMRGLMMLTNQQEVAEFLTKYRASGAELLSTLTKGVHLHTVEADNEEALVAIIKALKEKGYLLSQV